MWHRVHGAPQQPLNALPSNSGAVHVALFTPLLVPRIPTACTHQYKQQKRVAHPPVPGDFWDKLKQQLPPEIRHKIDELRAAIEQIRAAAGSTLWELVLGLSEAYKESARLGHVKVCVVVNLVKE